MPPFFRVSILSLYILYYHWQVCVFFLWKKMQLSGCAPLAIKTPEWKNIVSVTTIGLYIPTSFLPLSLIFFWVHGYLELEHVTSHTTSGRVGIHTCSLHCFFQIQNHRPNLGEHSEDDRLFISYIYSILEQYIPWPCLCYWNKYH